MLTKRHQYFIIGGTIKGATSSLFNYFSAHPQVCGSRIKETYFFSQGYSGSIEEDYKNYSSFFSPDPENIILMEASPNYLAYKENVAPRIKQLLPDIKLLFVLRNPVERLYSYFNFARENLQLSRDISFEKFIELCEMFNNGEIIPEDAGVIETHLRALETGNYGPYLQNFYDVFDAENIRVIFFEELNQNPLEKLVEISEFIGVSPTFFHDYTMNRANVTYSARIKFLHNIVLLLNQLLEPALRRYPGLKHRLVKIYKYFNKSRQHFEPMREETRNKLIDYYAPSNVKVKSILSGQKLPPWLG